MKELVGIISKQSGRYLITGITSFQDIFESSYINHWSDSKSFEKQGLQRKPIPSHYRKLAGSIANSQARTWIPTPIVLSSGFPLNATIDVHNNIVGFEMNSEVEVELLHTEVMTSNQLVKIKFAKKSLSIIDGQHRMKAMEYLIKDKNTPAYKTFNLPFIIMFPQNKVDEIVTFIDLNSKGKKVKTDLANQLRLDIDKEDQNFEHNEADRKKMISTKISNILNSEIDSVWYNKITIGNNTGLVVSSTTWVSSLRQIYSVSGVKSKYEHSNKDIDTMARLLSDLLIKYWKIIYSMNPNLFSYKDNSTDIYVIQKSVGVSVLNQVLIGILRDFIVKPLDKISEEDLRLFITENFDKAEYFTEEFWRSSNKKEGVIGGRASESSSESAFKTLSVEMLEDIKNNFYSED